MRGYYSGFHAYVGDDTNRASQALCHLHQKHARPYKCSPASTAFMKLDSHRHGFENVTSGRRLSFSFIVFVRLFVISRKVTVHWQTYQDRNNEN